MSEEELLAEFEKFEQELEVEEILKKVKSELSFLEDDSVDELAQQQREQQKLTAQFQREKRVRQQWSPGHYPQLTCEWFIRGLDFCCDHWRFQFKRPPTPPPPVEKELKN